MSKEKEQLSQAEKEAREANRKLFRAFLRSIRMAILLSFLLFLLKFNFPPEVLWTVLTALATFAFCSWYIIVSCGFQNRELPVWLLRLIAPKDEHEEIQNIFKEED